MSRIQLIIVACLLAGTLALAGACKSSGGSQSSPTEAYKTLYAAVHRKDVEAIKKVLSKTTIEFMTAAAGMQKKPLDDVIVNGTIESNLSPTMPELCKERIKGEWGALEVKGASGKWEDVPFVLEDGQWKVAVGDIFKGTYQKPGDTLCMPAQQNIPAGPVPNGPSTGPVAPGNTGPTDTKPGPAQPAPLPQNAPNGPIPIKPPTKASPDTTRDPNATKHP